MSLPLVQACTETTTTTDVPTNDPWSEEKTESFEEVCSPAFAGTDFWHANKALGEIVDKKSDECSEDPSCRSFQSGLKYRCGEGTFPGQEYCYRLEGEKREAGVIASIVYYSGGKGSEDEGFMESAYRYAEGALEFFKSRF